MVGFRMFARDANIFVLSIEVSALVPGAFWGQAWNWYGENSGAAVEYGGDTYHVKRNDIFEGDLSGFVFLDEDLVDENWTRSSWESEHEWMFRCWVEVLDSVFRIVIYCFGIAG
jgi:hypothetical protein